MKKLIVLLGPPGVGKGTQCGLLSSRLGFKHISTGSIIRDEIKSQSELGMRVKALVESGNLVDDKTIFSCLDKALKEVFASGEKTILLDGLPRNISQAQVLDELVQKLGFDSYQVICLEADTSLLTKRFESRFTCNHCNAVESIQLEASMTLSDLKCKSCGAVGSLYRRQDDEPSTVRHRLELYQRETHPLVAYYSDKKNISFVNGLLPPEIVYAKVASFLI